MENAAVIVSRARTPIGSFQGNLSGLSAPKLGAVAIQAALQRAGVSPGDVNEVIMGEVLTAGVGQAPARQASIFAGIPTSVPCTTVNKVCGSGLKAIMMARQSIQLGEANVCVAGGMESMSNAPYLLPTFRKGARMGDQTAIDSMFADGLLDPYSSSLMGVFAEQCVSKYHFSREAQDAYARESYKRALAAQKAGYFANEIAPVQTDRSVDEDEEPARFSPEKISLLKPVFSKDGTVTAANASKIDDAAAAVIVMSEGEAKRRGLKPLAKIVSTATFAQDPAWFTTAPVGAIQLALKRAGMSVSDVDLFEINEAFAAVAMAAMQELNLSHDKVNVWGGAISLGHPLGCSGARIVVTLLSAMEERGVRVGCAAVCLGGGEAVAMVLSRD